MRVFTHHGRRSRLLLALVAVSVALPVFTSSASAATPAAEGFSIQVSPSPLTATLTPGVTTTLDLQIRNTANQTQDLKMGLRSFSIAEANGQVNLSNGSPTDVQSFVSFSNPNFSVQAGQIFTQHVTIKTPPSAGFTYSFAITVSQQNPPKAANGKTAITGSVAVFTLLSVNKPGAVRSLQLSKLSVSKHVYEFLPASITLTFKNNGNTLVQPTGTLFIQRHSSDTVPLAAITINKGNGYILPGTSRSLTSTWNDGFPHYDTVTVPNKPATTKLSWQGSSIGKLRIGRYVAKVVAVYDNGGRDVPITTEVSFMVIPWRILLAVFFVLLLLLVGVFTIIRNSTRKLRRKTRKTVAKDVHKTDVKDKS